LKIFLILSLTMLSACSWLHRKAPPQPEPPQVIVTGAPAESIVFVDDVQSGVAAAHNDTSEVLSVAEGTHTVEVRMGDRVVYRESLFVKNGERRIVTVLSGSNRE